MGCDMPSRHLQGSFPEESEMKRMHEKTIQARRWLRLSTAAVAVSALATLAAGPAGASQGHGQALQEQNRELRADLARLEKSVSAFYSYDVARAAGWDTVISECVESPMGGMGFHVANLDELNAKPFSVSLLRPEVLLYAPTEDGSMEFLGVEYIVPWTPGNASSPPSLLGQVFEFNPNVGPDGIWALHVWIGRHNPAGIFAPFNPTVSCEWAGAAE